MVKTYKVTIWREKFSPFLGHYRAPEERMMTYRELYEERMKVSRWIISDFRWKDYDKDFRHLVYCFKMGDEYTIYPHGYLLTDRQFEENVASQQGAGLLFDRVWAYHKNV